MAGTVTHTDTSQEFGLGSETRRCRIVTFTWVGDASDGTVLAYPINLRGWLIKAITNPGSPAPTDNYDIALGDPEDSALDALGSILANRSTSTTQQVYTNVTGAVIPVFLNGTYSLTISNNSQASATGTITFYLIDSQ